MALKRCQNCEQIIGNLEESYFYQGHVVCKKCNNILDKETAYLSSSKQKSLNEIPEVIERNPSPKIGYIRKHWRGKLSLAVSFWVNLFLLNIALWVFFVLLGYGKILKSPVIIARVMIIYSIFYIVVVYTWQIVGLWRSCNRHIGIYGKQFWARTAQVLIVLGLVLSLGKFETSWLTYKDLYRMGFQEDEWRKYTLKLEKDNTLIHLQGGLGFGVSKEVDQLLKGYPEIEGIILDSSGGRIYEGRELAKLISAYGLDTYSLEGCYSAATIAFIAGEKRFLGTGANLAYHQYQTDYESLDAYADMKEEQSKDLLLFQQQGVKSEFLERLFEASPDDLWYPTIDEMLDAGVIHGIVNPSDLLPVEYGLTSNEIDEAYLEIMEAFLNIPVYKTIKQYEPDIFREINETLDNQVRKGATMIELQSSVTNIISPLAFAALSQTSDEAIIQFIRAFLLALKKLRKIDPILCMKAIYPQQYGHLDLSKYYSDDESNLMLEAMNKIIIDTYEKNSPPVDIDAAELLMEELVLKLEEHVYYLDLEDLQNTEDYGRHCDALIKLYELILAEDKIAAGNISRYIFSSE